MHPLGAHDPGGETHQAKQRDVRRLAETRGEGALDRAEVGVQRRGDGENDQGQDELFHAIHLVEISWT